MTRSIVLTAACAVALLGLAACDPKVHIARKERHEAARVLTAPARLDCPQSQGALKLVSAAADGKACAYTAANATEVSLRLMPVDGLTAVETELKGLIPSPPPSSVSEVKATDAPGDDKDDAHIRLPGLSIDAQGDKASVNIGGIHINDRGEGNADIQINSGKGDGVSIMANGDGAEIRQEKSSGGGLRKTLILANDKPAANGYRLVGFEARGPEAGPLVVAVVHAKGEHHNNDVFKDMKALVSRNTGG
jgi:hypothetical protein